MAVERRLAWTQGAPLVRVFIESCLMTVPSKMGKDAMKAAESRAPLKIFKHLNRCATEVLTNRNPHKG